jgi:hypothetical protein
MVVIAKLSVDELSQACSERGIVYNERDIREFLLSIRLRLDEIADGLSTGEQANARVFVLEGFYSELTFAAAGLGLDNETLGTILWYAWHAAATGTKHAGKLAAITEDAERWSDIVVRLANEADNLEDLSVWGQLRSVLPDKNFAYLIGSLSFLGMSLLLGSASGRYRLLGFCIILVTLSGASHRIVHSFKQICGRRRPPTVARPRAAGIKVEDEDENQLALHQSI